jgi:hypothetical protein
MPDRGLCVLKNAQTPKSKSLSKEIAKVECAGHPLVKFVAKTKCQIERLTKNAVCTLEKAKKKNTNKKIPQLVSTYLLLYVLFDK